MQETKPSEEEKKNKSEEINIEMNAETTDALILKPDESVSTVQVEPVKPADLPVVVQEPIPDLNLNPA